eukprot:Gregarina_sp_Poly_1__10506@NODE_770_length_6346_cov_91_421086_g567_i0_p3_GENE_NODE_770_length_6346_cov_91_421086_g567_i0NODE_770_length_6346_cov_91_421086_g567_i0_p3_ORF_typecomplete_len385_score69_21_NODE_770_length_6346_cov_91_421086_g567_i023013455
MPETPETFLALWDSTEGTDDTVAQWETTSDDEMDRELPTTELISLNFVQPAGLMTTAFSEMPFTMPRSVQDFDVWEPAQATGLSNSNLIYSDQEHMVDRTAAHQFEFAQSEAVSDMPGTPAEKGVYKSSAVHNTYPPFMLQHSTDFLSPPLEATIADSTHNEVIDEDFSLSIEEPFIGTELASLEETSEQLAPDAEPPNMVPSFPESEFFRNEISRVEDSNTDELEDWADTTLWTQPHPLLAFEPQESDYQISHEEDSTSTRSLPAKNTQTTATRPPRSVGLTPTRETQPFQIQASNPFKSQPFDNGNSAPALGRSPIYDVRMAVPEIIRLVDGMFEALHQLKMTLFRPESWVTPSTLTNMMRRVAASNSRKAAAAHRASSRRA